MKKSQSVADAQREALGKDDRIHSSCQSVILAQQQIDTELRTRVAELEAAQRHAWGLDGALLSGGVLCTYGELTDLRSAAQDGKNLRSRVDALAAECAEQADVISMAMNETRVLREEKVAAIDERDTLQIRLKESEGKLEHLIEQTRRNSGVALAREQETREERDRWKSLALAASTVIATNEDWI